MCRFSFVNLAFIAILVKYLTEINNNMNRIKLTILSSLLTVATLLPLQAKVLSPSEALARIGDSRVVFHVKDFNSISEPQLVFTGFDSKDTPALYIFGEETGFLVAAASDAVPALLGYGDIGITNENQINPELKWWLEEYSRQIEYAETAGLCSNPDDNGKRFASDFSSISPLVKTTWNQDAPYNNLCPILGGRRCVTGCAATALAQVMKYYEWPTKGTGSSSYVWNNTTLSFNYGSTTFDWAHMLNEYSGFSTTTQKNAVATLMSAAGIAVEMDYSLDGSSTQSYKIGEALQNYFGYQKGINYYMRDYYNSEKWDELVYTTLRDFGPVLYGGQSGDGGHQFVIDGYSNNGYFHVNWGWGGISDGYFLLSALDPYTQGIGGSDSGFNYQQDIIGRVAPSKNGEQKPILPSILCETFNIQGSATINSVTYVEQLCYSGTTGINDFTLGVRAVSSEGSEVDFTGETYTMEILWGGDYWYEIYIPWWLPDGVYSIYPIAKCDGEWVDVYPVDQLGCTKSMIVENGNVTFSTEKISDTETETEWTSLGKAQFIDNIWAPIFGLSESAPSTTVEIFESKATPGVYRIKDAFIGTYERLGNNAASPDMIIDAQNPANVIIYPQFSGQKAYSAGEYLGNLIYFSDSWFEKTFGYYLGETPTLITLKRSSDGNITINIPALSMIACLTENNNLYFASSALASTVEFNAYGSQEESDWKYVDRGTFIDNVWGPLFGLEESHTPVYVDIECSTENPSFYRVVRAFEDTYARLGFYGSPNMLIDASNPENVIIPLQSLGLYGEDEGEYYYFSESWYENVYGELPEVVRITMNSDVNGNVEIIIPTYSCTLWAQDTNLFYYATLYPSYLRFRQESIVTGLGKMEAENDDATVYYNLQGLRIEEPRPGEIVIRVKGNKREKVLIR